MSTDQYDLAIPQLKVFSQIILVCGKLSVTANQTRNDNINILDLYHIKATISPGGCSLEEESHFVRNQPEKIMESTRHVSMESPFLLLQGGQ